MNEGLFLIHILTMLVFLMGSLYLGKQALYIFVSVSSLLANIFVVKQISLFSLTVTASDVFIIGAILATNLLQEFYGKKEAKKALYFSFVFLGFFLLLSKIHLGYTPAQEDVTHGAFARIFAVSPRIIVSSVLVFFVVQRIDVFFFQFLQKIFSYRFLSIRVFFSLVLSQLLDTFLFSYLALYGYVASIFHVIGMSLIIKLIIVLCSSTFLSFVKRWMPNEVYGE